jgi:hypothetical protein
MTAASGLKRVTFFPRDREASLVAFVGLASPLSSHAWGVLERCELTVLEFPTISKACHLAETLTFDAVVLDRRSLAGPSAYQRLGTLTAAFARGRRICPPLIVLASGRLDTTARRACEDAGAIVLSAHQQSLRHIAAVIRRACGRPDCCVRPSAQYTL